MSDTYRADTSASAIAPRPVLAASLSTISDVRLEVDELRTELNESMALQVWHGVREEGAT